MTKGDVPGELGREIRRRREALDMTLEQLAGRSGLTPNYVGTVENGKRDPSLSTVLSLAKGLSVRPGELFGSMPRVSTAAEEAGRLYDVAPREIQMPLLAILRATVRKKRRRSP